MEAMLQSIKLDFFYFGNNVISMAVYVMAAIYLFSSRKNDKVGKFIKYSFLFLILLLCPLVANDIMDFWFQDEYWKIFMMLLPVICIAIAIVRLSSEHKRIWENLGYLVVCLGIIALSMNFSFEEPKISKLENSYKVSEEVIGVDEILRSSGEVVVKMIAPREVCAQIREIDTSITLLYGEDMIERMIANTTTSESEEERQFIEFCSSIVAAPAAVQNQIDIAKLYGSNCIVLEKSYDDVTLMEDAGFERLGQTQKYVVYFWRG